MHRPELMLVLHAHLPYVRHPEHEYFLEENWLYEAALETYLPLINMIEGLRQEGVACRLTLSVSPPLLEMLADELLKERLSRHMRLLRELIEREQERLGRDPRFGPVIDMYARKLEAARRLYEDVWGRDLIAAFRALESGGGLQLITTSATHAYLPNLASCQSAVEWQLQTGLECFERHFGHRPSGLWLPECGYYEGLDALLTRLGVEYTFLENHGLLHATPRVRRGVYSPIRCPSGLLAFAREAESSRRIWCGRTGYPAHPSYREFHRDLGYDLPMGEIGWFTDRYTGGSGARIPTGLKYYRITGGGSQDKEVYDPEAASLLAREHAEDFIHHLVGLGSKVRRRYGFTPLITAPFDAELFGHWWAEGVEWLEHLIRQTGTEGSGVNMAMPEDYLGRTRGIQKAKPGLSSWGRGGYSETWAGGCNAQSAMELLRASWRMAEVRDCGALDDKALDQALRELLLAQSSDWTFMMHRAEGAERYAEGRLRAHLTRFYALLEGRLSGAEIEEIKGRMPVFRWLEARGA